MSKYKIRGHLTSDAEAADLSNYRVEAWDSTGRIQGCLGDAETRKTGKFKLRLNLSPDDLRAAKQRLRVHFKVYLDSRLVVDTHRQVEWRSEKPDKKVDIEIPMSPDNADTKVQTGGVTKSIIEIDAENLERLTRVANRTLPELRSTDSVLATHIENKAVDRIKAAIADHFTDSQIDVSRILGNNELIEAIRNNRPIVDTLSDICKSILDADKQEALAGHLSAWNGPGRLSDILNPDTPISRNPLLTEEMISVDFQNIANLSGHDLQDFKPILDEGLTIRSLNDELLNRLIGDQKIDETQAKDLAANIELYLLVDGDAGLAARLKQGVCDEQHQNFLRSLTALKQDEWLTLIEEEHADDTRIDKQLIARKLYSRIERLFPNDVFLNYYQPAADADLQTAIDQIPDLLGSVDPDLSLLDASLLEAELTSDQVESYNTLRKHANQYSGLGLTELFIDESLSSQKKVQESRNRIAKLEQFHASNRDVDLLALDYSPDSPDIGSLDFTDHDENDVGRVLEHQKIKQRIRSVATDSETAHVIMRAGYQNSTEIAFEGYDHFSDRTGIDKSTAQPIVRHAEKKTIPAAIALGIFHEERKKDPFHKTLGGNASRENAEYLLRLDSYRELFGQQDYCECRHCDSIISPSAYFVDLMQYIETKILTGRYWTRSGRNNPKVRRSDLWYQLKLGCDSTNTIVPYLTIILEILENFVADNADGRSLTTIEEIEDFVYQRLYVSKTEIADVDLHGFKQPFLRPLAEVDILLEHFDIERKDIVTLLKRYEGDTNETFAQAVLRTSRWEYEIVKYPNSNAAFLGDIYNFDIATTPEPNIKSLLSVMDLTRDEFEQLIALRFPTNDAVGSITVVFEELAPGELQPTAEKIFGLTADTYDRIHRFVRLWRKLDWSMAELDLLLMQLVAAGLELDPGQIRLDLIAQLSVNSARYKISINELCTLFHLLPSSGGDSFLAQRFGDLVDPADSFQHPAFRENLPDDSEVIKHHKLLSGLEIDDDVFIQLIQKLPLELAGAISTENFALSIDNLTLLARHVYLTNYMNLSVDELFTLIRIAPTLSNTFIADYADLSALLTIAEWQRQSGYSVAELAFVLSDEFGDTLPQPTAEEVLNNVVGSVQEGETLYFADTVFAFFDEVTEAQSRKIIGDNSTLFTRVADTNLYYLSTGFVVGTGGSSTLVIPPGISITDRDAHEYVSQYFVGAAAFNQLAGELGITQDTCLLFANMVDIALDNPATGTALHELVFSGTPAASTRNRVTAAVDIMRRLSVWFAVKFFQHDAFEYLYTNNSGASSLFNIGDFGAPTFADIQITSRYSALIEQNNGTLEQLNSVLEDFETVEVTRGGVRVRVHRFDYTTAKDALIAILDAEEGLINALNQVVSMPEAEPISALTKLAESVQLAQFLGVSGEALPAFVTGDQDGVSIAQKRDDFRGISHAVQMLRTAFRTKYSESEFDSKIEPFFDSIRESRRDALVDFLLNSVDFGSDLSIETINDLYHYLLIDTQLQGCARTSRLVAGISSLQLYVHRVLMNLEFTEDGLTPARLNHDAALEWQWRKNYRVWEANRKVFLFPENYLEPDLRDNKTEIFKELESELLQQEITQESALNAYAKYMAEFETLSNLKIAGAYHDRSEGSDVLHLFGVTEGEENQYYYRSVENIYKSDQRGVCAGIVWHPWTKVNLKISVKEVSPVLHEDRLYLFWAEIQTKPNNESTGGTAAGSYKHTIDVRYSKQKVDGTWSVSKKIFQTYEHDSNRDLLDSYKWNRAYPTSRYNGDVPELLIGYLGDRSGGFPPLRRNYVEFPKSRNNWSFTHYYGSGDLFENRINIVSPRVKSGTISRLTNSPYAQAQAIKHNESGERDLGLRDFVQNHQILRSNYVLDGYLQEFTRTVNGSLSDNIFDVEDELLYLHQGYGIGYPYAMKRLGTTVTKSLSQTLLRRGIEGLLDIRYQETILEADLLFEIERANVYVDMTEDGLDYKGSLGVYFREIFFHIPFLIANHQNAVRNFADAQTWYHMIFEPMSTKLPADIESLTDDERQERARDRVWQYLEFRNHDLKSLRDQLNDRGAFESYRSDPFNPHAIARNRLGAYKKAVFMKYIDNLLDWGDNLFSQDTTESINEATLLYVMASDLLGERPQALGDCQDEEKTKVTYYEIRRKTCAKIAGDAETLTSSCRKVDPPVPDYLTFFIPGLASALAAGGWLSYFGSGDSSISTIDGDDSTIAPDSTDGPVLAGDGFELIEPDSRWELENFGVQDWQNRLGPRFIWELTIPSFTTSLLRQACMFCIPVNEELLAYWDRVSDRLFKIRNCMNISGMRRELPLFAPPIDPRLLVRARAAGLSIQDILDVTSGNLPPYRFSFLIGKAKEYAGVLASFGAALQSALEKKDAEELNQLRMVHQTNALNLANRIRDMEIEAAEASIESLERRAETITARRDYLQNLLYIGLNDKERAKDDLYYLGHGLKAMAVPFYAASGPLKAAPSIVGFSFSTPPNGIAEALAAVGHIFNFAGEASFIASNQIGLHAGYDRRKDGWQHSRDQANRELREIGKQIEAARIRRDISLESRKLHENSIEQTEEIYEFYQNKFSNLGLYTLTSRLLQSLYRDAYQSALSIARLAEQAYRFERDADAVMISGSYWDPNMSGLLAGEKLARDLRHTEQQYMETHYRSMEIDQSFSLTQIAPMALIQLRNTGKCEFIVPELYFDLFYPGQYRRRIKSARLTIPCITGPYTNVSATLSLTDSYIRKEPVTGDEHLKPVPTTRSVVIATSTAQNDSGVFQLNFRDERYMPFEGAGAVSQWKLSLPKNFRTFDYHTINDVILHISYTAEYSELLRDNVEDVSNQLETLLTTDFSSSSPTLPPPQVHSQLSRTYSLRQEFSQGFHRLLHDPVNTSVPIEIAAQHFPLFLQGREIDIVSARLILQIDKEQFRVGGASLPSRYALGLDFSANGSATSSISEFTMDTDIELPVADLDANSFAAFLPSTSSIDTSFTIADAGDFATSNVSALDEQRLEDLFLELNYRIR